MRALVIYCHPRSDSYTAAVRDKVIRKLVSCGAEIRLLDLYARGFDPVMSAEEHRGYEDEAGNTGGIGDDVEALQWCDTLIFVYPTWWYGLPAMLKGWIDRVFVPGVAFVMPDETHKDIRPGLTHITRIAVFTTGGASWWLSFLVGAPGRKTILRGLRALCARRCRTLFCVQYLMDQASPDQLTAHLDKVGRKLDRFVGAQSKTEVVAE